MGKIKEYVNSVDIITDSVRACLIDEILQILENEQADLGFEVEPFIATPCPIHTSCWSSISTWIHEAFPELFNSHYLCPLKELFINKISDEFVTDRLNATATGAGNVRTRDRDDHMLEIAEIFRTQLLKVQPTTTIYPIIKMNDYPATCLSN